MRRARWKVCGMCAVFSHYHDSKPRQFLNSPPRQDARADSLRRPKQNATGPGLNDWSGSSVLREPIGDGAEGLGGHGFFDPAVFGGRARGGVVEKMLHWRGCIGLRVLRATILNSLLHA